MKKNNILAIGITLVLCVSVLFSGCGNKQANQTVSQSEQKTTTKDSNEKTVTIKDMNGREVKIPSPKELKSVYYASPLGQLMIYSINPDKMAGIVSEASPEQLKYMPKLNGKQVLGNFDGGKNVNPEQVLAGGTQVFIQMGPMTLNDKTKAQADELQSKLGIPVVVVNGLLEKRADAYRFLGTVFGEENRCEQLAKYCEDTLSDVNKKLETIKDEDRVTLYYAEKQNGLATEPDTSSHAAVFKYAGAKNVANVENSPGSGMTPVTLEQILAWNPDVIFMGGGKSSPYKNITTNPDWANLKAVKEGKVYEAPSIPYSWIDRPPSSQQYLGIKYVANVLYPKTFNYDIKKEAVKFFKLFYQVDVTEKEMGSLLGEK